MKIIKKLFVVVSILVTLMLSGCNNNNIEKIPVSSTMDEDTYGMSFPVQLREAIEVVDAFLYTGVFPEDGSFEHKENVFALIVKNNSLKDLQLVRIDVKTDVKDYFFEITSLPSGESVTVFEKNGATITNVEVIESIQDRNIVFFNEKMSVHPELFQITPMDSIITIQNYSKRDFDSDVYVYYKKIKDDGSYFGGITFRTNVGSLKTEEIKQVVASHFNRSDSKVVFIGYAPE